MNANIINSHVIAHIQAKRRQLQQERRRRGDTPELICEEISAWVEAEFGWPRVRGCYAGIPHNYNLIPETQSVLDCSADQFPWLECPDGIYYAHVSEAAGHRYLDEYALDEVERRLGPIKLDPVFDEFGLFLPIADHPLFGSDEDGYDLADEFPECGGTGCDGSCDTCTEIRRRRSWTEFDYEGYALTRWVEDVEHLEPYPDYTDDWDPPQYDPYGEMPLFRRSGYSDLGEPWHNEDEYIDTYHNPTPTPMSDIAKTVILISFNYEDGDPGYPILDELTDDNRVYPGTHYSEEQFGDGAAEAEIEQLLDRIGPEQALVRVRVSWPNDDYRGQMIDEYGGPVYRNHSAVRYHIVPKPTDLSRYRLWAPADEDYWDARIVDAYDHGEEDGFTGTEAEHAAYVTKCRARIAWREAVAAHNQNAH